MAIKLSSNPTCTLTDADNLTTEQRQKLNLNLTKGIPGSNISGDKVTVINSDGEVEMKSYSAGGGGSSYTAGDGIEISDDRINVLIDDRTLEFNPVSGVLQANPSGKVALIDTSTDSIHAVIQHAIGQNQFPVLVTNYGEYCYLTGIQNIGLDIESYDFVHISYMSNEKIGYFTATVDSTTGYTQGNYLSHYFVPSIIPGTDEGKVLKVVSGEPTWVTP